MLKIKQIKKEFAKDGFRIGKEAIQKFVQHQENRLLEDLKKIERNARISGRKVIREEDFRE